MKIKISLREKISDFGQVVSVKVNSNASHLSAVVKQAGKQESKQASVTGVKQAGKQALPCPGVYFIKVNRQFKMPK